jgi:hypothetical protein
VLAKEIELSLPVLYYLKAKNFNIFWQAKKIKGIKQASGRGAHVLSRCGAASGDIAAWENVY